MKEEFKNDHDAIVTLVAEVRQIRQDIRDLRDNTSFTIQDHEKRLNIIENKTESSNIYWKLTVALGVLVVGLLVFHLTGYKI
jgi:hypothetical protein